MPYFWSKSYLGFPVVGRVEEGWSITLADATGLCCNYAIPAQVKIPSPTLSPWTFEGMGLEDLGIWPRSFFFWIHDCPMLMLGVRGFNRVYPRSPSASVGKRKRDPSLKAKTWSAGLFLSQLPEIWDGLVLNRNGSQHFNTECWMVALKFGPIHLASSVSWHDKKLNVRSTSSTYSFNSTSICWFLVDINWFFPELP